jgi:hypothetical protein
MSFIGRADARMQVSQLFAQLTYRIRAPNKLQKVGHATKREMAERKQCLRSRAAPVG